MSEFSSSYHILTSDPQGSIKRIRAARLSGLAFPSKGKWLSFVPYEEPGLPGGLLDALVKAVDRPVLWYTYAEDHGWSFDFAPPGTTDRLAFERSWDPETSTGGNAAGNPELTRLLADKNDLPALQAILGSGPETAEEPAAYRFAELLGLPVFRWISPQYVASEPTSFLAQNGRRIGSKPKAAEVACPPARQVKLERTDLSAREAFLIAQDFMRSAGSGWKPKRIFGQGPTPPARVCPLGRGVLEGRRVLHEGERLVERSGDSVGLPPPARRPNSFQGHDAGCLGGQPPSPPSGARFSGPPAGESPNLDGAKLGRRACKHDVARFLDAKLSS